MRHISALVVKFIMTAVILEVILLLFNDLTFGNILWIALLVTVIGYALGDMVILPATNNFIAAIVDMGLSLIVIYLFNFIWNTNHITFIGALISGIAIGLGEIFYHKIIDRSMDEDRMD